MQRDDITVAIGVVVLSAAVIGVVAWGHYQAEQAAIDRVRAGFAAALRCQESGEDYDAKTRHCHYR